MQERTKPTIVLAGGTGFLGKHTATYFSQIGYHVVVLTRGENRYENAIHFVHWDTNTPDGWWHVLEQAVAVFNFTGQSIQSVPTEANRYAILQSRIHSVKALTTAILRCQTPPSLFVQMSAVGYYGDTLSLCTEEAPLGKGFMAEVCDQWEKTFMVVNLPATRKIIFRLGIVLAKDGGVLPLLIRLTKSFLGASIGSGKQGISWIHMNDLMQLLRCSLYKRMMEGVYNISSEPVSNETFMKVLRKVLNRPWMPAVPLFIASKVARWVLKTDPEILLTGCYAFSKRLTEEGCIIQFNELEGALNDLILH
jgi:uncharacterized protein (TIGR01777 family)